LRGSHGSRIVFGIIYSLIRTRLRHGPKQLHFASKYPISVTLHYPWMTATGRARLLRNEV
jgi:hypothetical protein